MKVFNQSRLSLYAEALRGFAPYASTSHNRFSGGSASLFHLTPSRMEKRGSIASLTAAVRAPGYLKPGFWVQD